MPAIRELGFSPDEIFRHLPYALRGFRLSHDAAGLVTALRPGGARVMLQVEPLPPRRLSEVLTLPCCRVRLAFEGFDAVEQAAFLANFDRAFWRGGG